MILKNFFLLLEMGEENILQQTSRTQIAQKFKNLNCDKQKKDNKKVTKNLNCHNIQIATKPKIK